MKILKKLLKLIIYLVSIISLIIIGGNINYCSNQNKEKTQERRVKKANNNNFDLTDQAYLRSIWNSESIDFYYEDYNLLNYYDGVNSITIYSNFYLDNDTELINYMFYIYEESSGNNYYLTFGGDTDNQNLFITYEDYVKLYDTNANYNIYSHSFVNSDWCNIGFDVYDLNEEQIDEISLIYYFTTPFEINELGFEALQNEEITNVVHQYYFDNNDGNAEYIAELEAMIESLTYERDQARTELLTYQTLYNQLLETHQGTLEQLTELTTTINRLNNEITNLESEIDDLESNIQNLTEENQSLNNEIDRLEIENERLKQEYQKAYDQGLADGQEQAFNIINFLERILLMLDNILNVEILPYIRLWYIVAIPLILGVVKMVLSWFR